MNHPDVVQALKTGQLVVARTDTLYGILATVANQTAVAKLFTLKERASHKPLIILIASTNQLLEGSLWPVAYQTLAHKYWPGPVTIVVPVTELVPQYLHRGSGSVAYRVPGNLELCQLLEQTGPLVAPSANPEGTPPARDVEQAIAYFGDDVAVYVDGGEVHDAAPSRIVAIDSDMKERWLR
ncbi:MAG: L-threonylcarbamoyladenylate synthase [Microcoleus sp.]